MVESFLRHKGLKTGLYTSPHLVVQNERIRINFEPLQEDKFAKYFFDVYEGLGLSEEITSPRYLQLLALMSFHVFVKEEVDVAIYETHHGGQYDATNVIPRPLVSAITPIGMDHIAQLGPSIENIAWHKAGIIKAGAPALSAPQPAEVVKVLQDRAAEKETSVEFVQPRHDLDGTGLPELQQQNCSLAIAISDCVLIKRQLGALSRQDVVGAMNQFRWPGRFQIIPRSDGTWFLDGAHNDLSIERSAEWFSEVSKAET
jgi:folylpolyglutamate synthase